MYAIREIYIGGIRLYPEVGRNVSVRKLDDLDGCKTQNRNSTKHIDPHV